MRVLPRPLHLDALLKPSEPRTVAGAHLTRVRGPGTDLAELRPYVPGDRLRDLSWSATARTGEPWVIVCHPERTGTVVVAPELRAAHKRNNARPPADPDGLKREQDEAMRILEATTPEM